MNHKWQRGTLKAMSIIIASGCLWVFPAAQAASAASAFGTVNPAWLAYYQAPADQANWATFCQKAGGTYDPADVVGGVPACGNTEAIGSVYVPQTAGSAVPSEPGWFGSTGAGAMWESDPGFQCTEFAHRYLFVKYGFPAINGANGNGAGIVQDYGTAFKLPVVQNGGSTLPEIGDVVSFSDNAQFSDVGHVAVVSKVAVSAGKGYIEVIGENQRSPKLSTYVYAGAGPITINVSDGKLVLPAPSLGAESHAEWLNLPAVAPTVDPGPDGPLYWEKSTVAGAAEKVASLSDVSCPTTAFCMAVGGDVVGSPRGDYAVLNDGLWEAASLLTPSDDIVPNDNGLSCPSAGFCVLMGTQSATMTTKVLVYRNGEWGPPNPVPGTFLVLSCASPRFCLAIGSAGIGEISTFNGKTWTTTRQTSWYSLKPYGYALSITSLSCPSPTFCVAVGYAGDPHGGSALLGYAVTYDHGSWGVPTQVSSQMLLTVSCSGPTFCAAYGLDHMGSTYNGKTWSTVSGSDGGYCPTGGYCVSVSCPAIGHCLVAEGYGGAAGMSGGAGNGELRTFKGGKWAPATVVTSMPPFAGVSCATSSFCVVVDRQADAWIGTVDY